MYLEDWFATPLQLFATESDTLVITRLARLARSVVHLAQLAKRFEKEKINLIVIDQNSDTSTSTGRLMFNMLASIAEFENDLRTERQAEGIAKAKENGVKFGRPEKLDAQICDAIYDRRTEGATIGQLAKEFDLGEATIYRALKTDLHVFSHINRQQLGVYLRRAQSGVSKQGLNTFDVHVIQQQMYRKAMTQNVRR